MYHLFSTTILNSSFEKAVNLFLQKILKVFMETSELLECFEGAWFRFMLLIADILQLETSLYAIILLAAVPRGSKLECQSDHVIKSTIQYYWKSWDFSLYNMYVRSLTFVYIIFWIKNLKIYSIPDVTMNLNIFPKKTLR